MFVLKDTILETQKAKNKELERKGRVQYNKVSKGELFQKWVLNLKIAAAKQKLCKSRGRRNHFRRRVSGQH